MSVETIEEALQEKIEDQENESLDQSQEQPQEDLEKEPEQYEPNFGYSIRSQDHEFDEWIKPVITDKETEEKVRELYTRSQGLDHVKGHLSEAEKKVADLESEASRYREDLEFSKQGLEGLKQLAKTDFPTFAHTVGLDDQTILSYANNRLDYKEKPEYERQQIDQDLSRRAQSYESNFELDRLRRSNEKLMLDRHNQSLNQAMAQPEISKFKDQFDKRMGDGAFMRAVSDFGSSEFQATKRYVQPETACQHVYAKWKPMFEDKLEEINKQESKSSKAPTNLGSGRAGTVVKKRIKRISDLHKLGNELAKAGY